jgi:hypothetical protein
MKKYLYTKVAIIVSLLIMIIYHIYYTVTLNDIISKNNLEYTIYDFRNRVFGLDFQDVEGKIIKSQGNYYLIMVLLLALMCLIVYLYEKNKIKK